LRLCIEVGAAVSEIRLRARSAGRHETFQRTNGWRTGICCCRFNSVDGRCVDFGAAWPPISWANDAIKILVYNYAAVPPDVIKVAESEAERVLGVTASQLEWVNCAPVSDATICGRAWSKESPGLRFITGFNRYQPTELGHADVPVLATIYYEKVAQRVHQENADSAVGKVLGALMAHELCHVLIQESGHSPTGIMTPVWGSAQFRAAQIGRLSLTTEQLRRIESRFAQRSFANANSDARPQFGKSRPPAR
jgi:hypothetical protein